jgi:hypothetical protein
MTGVIYSTSFGGNTFVIAEFADGNSFYYYAGTLINDFQAGLIWSGLNNSFFMALSLANAINNITSSAGLPLYVASIPTIPTSLSLTITSGSASSPAVAAKGTLTFKRLPDYGSQVTIGSQTYTFVSTLNNAAANQVLLVGNVTNTWSYLYNAINGGSGSGTFYSSATSANSQATASNIVIHPSRKGVSFSGSFLVTASTAGVAGNSIATTTNASNSSWTGATLAGGINAVASPDGLASLTYNFPAPVKLTPTLTTKNALIVQSAVPFNASLSQTATDIATAINAAVDTYAGGTGVSLGFTASASGATVSIVPPAAITSYDTLTFTVVNNLQLSVTEVDGSFTITSIPTTASAKPFTVTPIVTTAAGGAVSALLLGVGVPVSPGRGSSATVTIASGTSNTFATGTLTFTKNPSPGDVVTIGGIAYTFVNELSSPAVPYEVRISKNVGQGVVLSAANNLAYATGAYGASSFAYWTGKLFSLGTSINPSAVGTVGLAGAATMPTTALANGALGNSVATTSASSACSWGALTLAGGTDTNQITQVALSVGPLNLLSSYVPFNTNTTQTAADLAAAINSGNSGYFATSSSNVVTISSTTTGPALDGQTITITEVGITSTTTAFAGGIDSSGGSGEQYLITVSGQWANGDKVTLILTDTLTGLQTQIGAGYVTGLGSSFATQPGTFCGTFKNKVYVLAGTTAYFSAVGDPTIWNDPTAAGDGLITMSNFWSAPEPLVAIAPYQGRLLFASRRNVQIWATDPDPANYAITQVLPYIGTFAPLSVQAVGDMDVYMLYDSGVRSVRVRDASNNAIIADVGTPIDAILQPLIAALSDAQKAKCCGIVDPNANRYWIYLPNPDGSPGTIFTFSYWPSSQIAAWGSYTPSYQQAVTAPAATYPAIPTLTYTGLTVGRRYAWKPGANELSITCGSTVLTNQPSTPEGSFVATATTATVRGISTAGGQTFTGNLSLTVLFVPEKFVIYNGQVWARSGDLLIQYGGSDNLTYDNCGVTWQIPYLSAQTPGTRKYFSAADAAMEGTWAINFSSDYDAATFKNVYNNTLSSFQQGRVPLARHATHFALQGVESGSSYARFSNALIHYTQEEEKGAP